MENGGESRSFTQPIQIITMDNTAPTPIKPLERQDLSSTYYYMCKYSNFIDMLSTNLELAMTESNRRFNNLSDLEHIETYSPPIFEIDPDFCQIVLNMHEIFTTSDNPATGHQLDCMSSCMGYHAYERAGHAWKTI